MWLQVKADALGDELPDDDTHERERTLDKELIQLIQFACKNDKLPRALDLTRLLHFTASFDLAMKVADFYHFRGLREKMQTLKDDREEHDREEGQRDKRRRWADDHAPVPPPRLPPAHNESNGRAARPFADFGPPPAIYRPGLSRATPSLGPGGLSNFDDDYTMRDEYSTPAPQAGPSEMKRKRSDDDELHRDSASPGIESAKRRAVVDDFATPAPPAPKPGTSHFTPVHALLLTTSVVAGTNPFASKSATAATRNPFNKPLQKSETFFEKVESAETGSRGTKGMFLVHRRDCACSQPMQSMARVREKLRLRMEQARRIPASLGKQRSSVCLLVLLRPRSRKRSVGVRRKLQLPRMASQHLRLHVTLKGHPVVRLSRRRLKRRLK